MNPAWIAWWAAQGVLVALWGLLAGHLANLAACLLRWEPQRFSPWAANHPRDDADAWFDCLPLLGWWRLRRKSRTLGHGFWIRSIAVEVASAGLFVALFVWEIGYAGLLPMLPWGVEIDQVRPQLYGTLLAHLLLTTWMLAATLVDIDEQTIPDSITVTGALVGLLLAAVVPLWLLPAEVTAAGAITATTLASPNAWPPRLAAAPHLVGLLVALGGYGVWCGGLLNRPWRTRRGLAQAVRILVARILRDGSSLVVLALAVVGTIGLATVWWIGGWRWEQVLSAVAGLTIGGLLVWVTRVLGRAALGREAMGFGDVTLLAMIGVYVGWQAALITFFLAPFAGLVLGLVQWVLHRDQTIPYGPFLCLATLATIVGWSSIWIAMQPYFAIWWLLPSTLAICFVLAYFLLWAMAAARRSGSRE